jgi:hypothetical protein
VVAYFVRRLAEGAVALLATAFVYYSLVVYCPGGIVNPIEGYPLRPSMIQRPDVLYLILSVPINNKLRQTSKLHYGWPVSYLAWLFDPQDTTKQNPNNGKEEPKGVDIRLGSIELKGSGILTGDWGTTSEAPYGQLVLELMGDSFWLYDLVILGLTFLAMVLVFFQRMGHRPRYIPPRFPFTPYDKASLTFRYTRPY